MCVCRIISVVSLVTFSEVIDYHDEAWEGNFLKCCFLGILLQAVFNGGEETGWRPNFNQFDTSPKGTCVPGHPLSFPKRVRLGLCDLTQGVTVMVMGVP